MARLVAVMVAVVGVGVVGCNGDTRPLADGGVPFDDAAETLPVFADVQYSLRACPLFAETTRALCMDGSDNDADGLVDCDDADCCSLAECGAETDCGAGEAEGESAECERVDVDVCGHDGAEPCIEGTEPPVIDCAVQTGTGGTRDVDFVAAQDAQADVVFRVSGATFSAGGSLVGAGCEVTITEGSNTYVAACGSAEPSSDQPCRIDAAFSTDDDGNRVMEVEIFCERLRDTGATDTVVGVTAYGPGVVAESSPGRFRLANCVGADW